MWIAEDVINDCLIIFKYERYCLEKGQQGEGEGGVLRGKQGLQWACLIPLTFKIMEHLLATSSANEIVQAVIQRYTVEIKHYTISHNQSH